MREPSPSDTDGLMRDNLKASEERARGLNVAQRCFEGAGIRSRGFSIPSIGRPSRSVLARCSIRSVPQVSHAFMKLFRNSIPASARTLSVILPLATNPPFFLNACLEIVSSHLPKRRLVLHISGVKASVLGNYSVEFLGPAHSLVAPISFAGGPFVDLQRFLLWVTWRSLLSIRGCEE